MKIKNFNKKIKSHFKNNKRPNLFLYFLILIATVIVFLFLYFYLSNNRTVWINNKIRENFTIYLINFKIKSANFSWQNNHISTNLTDNNFDIKSVDNIEASSYILYDFSKMKTVFSKDENKSMPLASISKLMTVYVASKYCQNILPEYINPILIISSNQAAENIAQKCMGDYDTFIETMNREASILGLNMFYKNSSGLDTIDGVEASNYGDAISVARLAKYLYDYDGGESFGITLNQYSDNGIENTNSFVNLWPFIIATKTGFTDTSNGNLVTLYNYDGDIFAIVVLHSSKNGRFTDTYKILTKYLYGN